MGLSVNTGKGGIEEYDCFSIKNNKWFSYKNSYNVDMNFLFMGRKYN